MTDRSLISRHRRRLVRNIAAALIFLALSFPVAGKTAIDFDPSLDFSKIKTFAYIGGVENLVMIQLNADSLNIRIHQMLVRELGKKGLHEVNPDQNPDLVVRYWANPESQVNVTVMGNWGAYGPFINSDWSYLYGTVPTASQHQSTLIFDFILPKAKALAWRLYLVCKLTDIDKDWKKAESEFNDGFKSYPPSDKDREEKWKERERQNGTKKTS
jgi:hypothetical protein